MLSHVSSDMPAVAWCNGSLSRLFSVSWNLGVLKHAVDVMVSRVSVQKGFDDLVMAMANSCLHVQMSSGFNVRYMI